MRILVVIPHYFGPSHPENNLPAIGSYIEPLGRIAALNDLIVGLHRHFGPDRYDLTGLPISEAGDTPRAIDIVVLAIRGHELTGELGFAPGTFEVEYVDCKPPWIAFEAQRVLRERLGRYDFYCFMEDDLVIHDPAFFDKLTWFQQSFGPKALLMPVRYEVAGTGTRPRSSSIRNSTSGGTGPSGGRDSANGSTQPGTDVRRPSVCRAIRMPARFS
jgi:hypothetical protein